ncbi:MAG TPA: FmdB family zinc ribbon protein [Spirillospora sp.]|nr:FmdB family zinc ribbon protein [Spirillospora sp.]
MPVYTYRRDDGTTFEYRQKFLDEPLEVCPTTGQKVVRVVQAPGIIFKGSGFYVNDSKSASNGNLSNSRNSGETKAESKTTEPKTETQKVESAAD